MRDRRLLGGMIGLVVVGLAGVAAAGQDRSSVSGASTELNGRLDAAEAAPAPQTPWGHPDLRGVWNNSTTTPYERLTEEERAQGRAAQAAVRAATDGTGAGWLEQA